MRKLWIGVCMGVVLAAYFVSCSPPPKMPDFATIDESAPIKRFAKVSDALYRGADPQAALNWLKKRGIKTLINLRTTDDYRKAAKAAKLKYFHLPMHTSCRPPELLLKRFLEIVTNKENQPVYVHCHYGIHRTGTLVAVYRMEVEGWDARKALAEARYFGFRRWHHPTLYDFIAEYRPHILKGMKEEECAGAAR